MVEVLKFDEKSCYLYNIRRGECEYKRGLSSTSYANTYNPFPFCDTLK